MKKIFLYISAVSLLTLGSCTKSILDINENPNSATNSTPQLTIPLALENAARITQTSYPNFGMWMGYTAINGGFALGFEANSYDLTTNFMAGTWDNLYINIANFNYVEKKAVEQGLPLYEAIAKLMQAYDYSCLVDLYNNVPYSDAMLKNGEQNISPKYDKGSDVYDSCIVQINQAITLLNDPATEASISKATDNFRIITFKGSLPDLTLWKKFANSLKLRLLINQSEAGKDQYIKAEVAKIDPALLLGVGEDVLADPGYLNSAGKLSPYYGSFFTNPGEAGDFYKMYHGNNYGVNFYVNNNDPRVSFFYDEQDGSYTGNDFGDQTADDVSPLGEPSLNPTAPSIIMTSAEALFDKAEAIQRGWIQGDAMQAYFDGIRTSFKYSGVKDFDAAATTYTAADNENVNWSKATNKIKLIITQKWAALNQLTLLTVYNDYRRTGFPVVPISKYSGHKPKVPLRILYPQSEYNKNAENVEAEGSIDPQTSKVFWDK